MHFFWGLAPINVLIVLQQFRSCVWTVLAHWKTWITNLTTYFEVTKIPGKFKIVVADLSEHSLLKRRIALSFETAV